MSISDLYLATERRRQRQRGRRHRAADTANPNLTPRDTCNSCGQAGHRSSRSHDCPNHNLSVQQLMIQRFGQGYQTYTIKCGVNSVVKQEYRQRFVEGVNQLLYIQEKSSSVPRFLWTHIYCNRMAIYQQYASSSSFFIQPCKLFKRVVSPLPTHTYQLSVYLRFGIACFQSIPSCRQ